jgi:hypothetical protein
VERISIARKGTSAVTALTSLEKTGVRTPLCARATPRVENFSYGAAVIRAVT